jgi:hypothetical protein
VEEHVDGDDFPKCLDLILKKIKTKNFRKRAEGAYSQMSAIVEAIERWIYKKRVVNAVIEQINDKNIT